MSLVRKFAPAKINLFLHVTGKRADGYHLLESLVAFADIGDDIIAEEAAATRVSIHGPYGEALNPTDNSVLQAARFYAAFHSIAAHTQFTLTKNLPVASGIGGGSADAAATLHALEGLYGRPMPDAKALTTLGADVPVCVHGQPIMMRGIGEAITPIAAFPVCDVVLINPGRSVATVDVFRRLEAPYSTPLVQPTAQGWPTLGALADFLQTTRNDLVKPALTLVPEVSAVVAALSRAPGCVVARMSGSGATCFGVFDSSAAAKIATETIAEGHPTWWIKQGQLGLARP
ncbi:MAG: 4-(cytidine 5'-diphospho)-2-C-methyl-D-erythritol kinase [Rhodospirillaceae bacterium]|nr:4-(cytidine 5'-diphospho)-2-C-methyl-D-erythritol kinase [Rhodospirillaceae bacterium]